MCTCDLCCSSWLSVRMSSSCWRSSTRASCFSQMSFSSIFMDSSISCFMPICTSSSRSTSCTGAKQAQPHPGHATLQAVEKQLFLFFIIGTTYIPLTPAMRSILSWCHSETGPRQAWIVITCGKAKWRKQCDNYAQVKEPDWPIVAGFPPWAACEPLPAPGRPHYHPLWAPGNTIHNSLMATCQHDT